MVNTREIQQPKRKDSGNFDGDIKEICSWWLSVLQYMDYAKSDFENNAPKISWLERFYKGKALS